MEKELENKFVEIIHRDGNGDIIKSLHDEVLYYTISGELLDSRGKALHDLTAIRIHMIDFGFDDFDKEVYDYVQDQIEKTREDIDAGKDLEAAARVICMELILGMEVHMASVVSEIRNGKVALPEEFNSDVVKRVISERLSKEEDENRSLLDDKTFSPGGEDAMRLFKGKK